MSKSTAFIVLLILSVVYSQKTSGFNRVIYGTDDRLDYFEVNSSLQDLGDSSVIILFGSDILTDNGDGTFTATETETAEDFWNFCPSERFSQQPILSGAGSFCSGFLLSNDPPWIGSAGHCTEGSFANTLIIFGFEVISSDTTRLTFAADDVYTVSRVVTQGNDSGSSGDYGIYELDRPVVGHTPLTEVNDNLSVGDSLTIIGHPVGLPKKFDSGGEVTELSSNLIVGTVDSYGGNSGSPIYDANQRLVGILVGGAPDFVYDGPCEVSNVCPGGTGCGSGEAIVPICDLLLSTTEVENQLGLCGATPDPTPAATPDPTPNATPDATPNATPNATPDATPNATPDATPNATPNATPDATPTSPLATPTASSSPNAAASNSQTRTPSAFSFSTADDDDLLTTLSTDFFTTFSTDLFSTITSFFTTVSSDDDDSSASVSDDSNSNSNSDDDNNDDDFFSSNSSSASMIAVYSTLVLSIIFLLF